MQKMKRTEPSTREMERINWLEFRDWVPTKIATVLLPLGTLEPHGVAPNGTDILAPRAIAREIAPRVNAMIAPVTCSGKSQNRSRHSIKSTESGDCENLG
jgi:creatinine amidohydrolase/Fe(II)-dependent formamide hydrolase-like protein